MRWRVDKVESVVWLLLKLVMEAKNRRKKKKKKCIKAKEGGRASSLKELIGEEKLERGKKFSL
jgi:hypothetical protein